MQATWGQSTTSQSEKAEGHGKTWKDMERHLWNWLWVDDLPRVHISSGRGKSNLRASARWRSLVHSETVEVRDIRDVFYAHSSSSSFSSSLSYLSYLFIEDFHILSIIIIYFHIFPGHLPRASSSMEFMALRKDVGGFLRGPRQCPEVQPATRWRWRQVALTFGNFWAWDDGSNSANGYRMVQAGGVCSGKYGNPSLMSLPRKQFRTWTRLLPDWLWMMMDVPVKNILKHLETRVSRLLPHETCWKMNGTCLYFCK